MKLLYENSSVAVFLFPDRGIGWNPSKDYVVVINKEKFAKKEGDYNRVIGTFFCQNIERPVENGSYIQNEIEKWFTEKVKE